MALVTRAPTTTKCCVFQSPDFILFFSDQSSNFGYNKRKATIAHFKFLQFVEIELISGANSELEFRRFTS